MKAHKLALLFIAFYGMVAEGSRCFRRREKIRMAAVKNEMRCEQPTNQLVVLPVPKGFDFVIPSMTKAMRCSGMLCWGMNRGCRATNVTMKSVKVEANDMMGNKRCAKVKIEEHHACGCGCITSQDNCKENEVFDPSRCACKCRDEDRDACQSPDSSSMWREDICSCVCTPEASCPIGSLWIQEHCSCMQQVEQNRIY